MRTRVRTALAVLFLAFCVVCARTPLTTRPLRRHHRHDKNNELTTSRERISEAAARRREVLLQQLQGQPSECCPTVTDTVTPITGRSQSGKSLQLINMTGVVQRFNETSCKNGFLNKPCRYIDRHLRRYTRCVQQYSYVYALVKDPDSNEGPRLDYIQIRSGCSCQLIPKEPT